MYKVNFKAVVLVYLLQLIVGAIWYSAAPANIAHHLEGTSIDGISSSSLIGFCIALLCYTYFSGWLLAKANLRSAFDRMLLIISSWLFLVLPNIFFIGLFVDFASMSIGYLLSYGFICSVIAACILPFWRASRTIFKG